MIGLQVLVIFWAAISKLMRWKNDTSMFGHVTHLFHSFSFFSSPEVFQKCFIFQIYLKASVGRNGLAFFDLFNKLSGMFLLLMLSDVEGRKVYYWIWRVVKKCWRKHRHKKTTDGLGAIHTPRLVFLSHHGLQGLLLLNLWGSKTEKDSSWRAIHGDDSCYVD